MHVEFTRDNALCCEGRASKKYLQIIFYKTKPISAALREMHDKASYQLLSLAEVAVEFAVGFSLTLI
jgi:hypothetical protein